eukprot:CAMPEP_0172413954 /NCGR_PEP_ID=MMETSP1064-20121228/536_1 /TAXON_ID=202472 /ORGANISM="Aulacoseira subarctica , Strain CCAP 1002/5" /LENGTH=41 /DNA_ID= /DNA_START= /DNA_END= /DNA_ORIENTATION=
MSGFLRTRADRRRPPSSTINGVASSASSTKGSTGVVPSSAT